ncbi:hypothetical protein MBLNU459_g2372t1 [Dothideomycetes sp. NU459]
MSTSSNPLPTSSPSVRTSLDLSSLPPIFLFSTHLETDDLHELEEQIVGAGGLLTYDVNEAKLLLSKAERRKRIELDLRGKGLYTEQVDASTEVQTALEEARVLERSAKRQRLSRAEANGQDEEKAIVIDDESTDTETETNSRAQPEPVKQEAPLTNDVETDNPGPMRQSSIVDRIRKQTSGPTIKTLKLQWFEDCVKSGEILPIETYLTYEGRIIPKPQPGVPLGGAANTSSPLRQKTGTQTLESATPRTILERAQADAPSRQNQSSRHGLFGKQRFGHGSGAPGTSFGHSVGNKSQHAHLLQQSTSEYDEGMSSDLPEMPDWVKQGVKYACQRSTLADPPNNDFIELLKKIKLARLLTNDEIGVRAYSTSIAALASYPHKLSSPREILALPGCDVKIANLYVEYANTGAVRAADDAEHNEELQVLRLFYNIWGVGALTARDFYHDRGWRELDDIVEYGWGTLSRVQQIGVKYYSEFLQPIPRAEVEAIAGVIKRHAVLVRDGAIQTCVVGGYRRGKALCGDVDILVSHPDERQTLGLVADIVASLETEGWVTHTLLLSLASTQRGQQTLPFRSGAGGAGHGFDTLDKALVVWQDPDWATKDADLAADPKAKNPNVHRRVDIIISPWRTVGAAVAGWSGGTTFQRDLRRYAKNVKGWKFDSSGVRDRAGGQFVDLEGWADEANRSKTMEEAERRVFAGLGLAWREPWERCTG